MGGKLSKSSARRKKSRECEPEIPPENPIITRHDEFQDEEIQDGATSVPQDPAPQPSHRRHRREKGKQASVNIDEASDHQGKQHSGDSDSVVSRSSRRRHRHLQPGPEDENPPLSPAYSLQQPENYMPIEYGNPYPAQYIQNENNKNFPIAQPQQETVTVPTIYYQLFSSKFPYGIPEQRISEVGEIWRIKSGVPVSYTRYCKY